jgi:hypothetical protein
LILLLAIDASQILAELHPCLVWCFIAVGQLNCITVRRRLRLADNPSDDDHAGARQTGGDPLNSRTPGQGLILGGCFRLLAGLFPGLQRPSNQLSNRYQRQNSWYLAWYLRLKKVLSRKATFLLAGKVTRTFLKINCYFQDYLRSYKVTLIIASGFARQILLQAYPQQTIRCFKENLESSAFPKVPACRKTLPPPPLGLAGQAPCRPGQQTQARSLGAATCT